VHEETDRGKDFALGGSVLQFGSYAKESTRELTGEVTMLTHFRLGVHTFPGGVQQLLQRVVLEIVKVVRELSWSIISARQIVHFATMCRQAL
jgi:hypothetical protein